MEPCPPTSPNCPSALTRRHRGQGLAAAADGRLDEAARRGLGGGFLSGAPPNPAPAPYTPRGV
jgi:hypothetical protein